MDALVHCQEYSVLLDMTLHQWVTGSGRFMGTQCPPKRTSRTYRPSTILLRNSGVLTTQWRSVKTNWILCCTVVKTQNSLTGHKIPPVPILGHTNSIHVLIKYFFDSYQNAPPHIKDGFGLCMPFPRLCVRSSPIITQMAALDSKHYHLEVRWCNWINCFWATQIGGVGGWGWWWILCVCVCVRARARVCVT